MKKLIFIVLTLLLIYTRFVNIGWGFPYPMHPDEWNMAIAIQQLHCNLSTFQLSNLTNCFNPHFFAYGQFPLYLGYIGVLLMKFFDGILGTVISFQEATFSLRVISALASVINAFVLFKIVGLIDNSKSKIKNYCIWLFIVLSPGLIQLSHFGTTESLLIMLYSSLIYLSLLYWQKKLSTNRFIILSFLLSGVSSATKISSMIIIFLPLLVIVFQHKRKLQHLVIYSILYVLFSVIVFVFLSPHNLISFNEFFNSMQYESSVALGTIPVFYTRQFLNTTPIIFQFVKIYPFVLGWPVLTLSVAGFLFLSWKKNTINFLRIAFFLVFLPNAVMYAKWTRFIAPTFSLMIIFALLFLFQAIAKFKLLRKKSVILILVILCSIPGLAYLSVYQNQDVRFQASEWIYKNIPVGSLILSETANVVNIPLEANNYRLISFDFYELDQNILLQQELRTYLSSADYVIVPSRRIFKNHAKEQYPLLNEYYRRLFSGTLGFKQVAEFTAFPKINILGRTLIEFPDEQAEETWSVFDHPVIRIYKKI